MFTVYLCIYVEHQEMKTHGEQSSSIVCELLTCVSLCSYKEPGCALLVQLVPHTACCGAHSPQSWVAHPATHNTCVHVHVLVCSWRYVCVAGWPNPTAVRVHRGEKSAGNTPREGVRLCLSPFHLSLYQAAASEIDHVHYNVYCSHMC